MSPRISLTLSHVFSHLGLVLSSTTPTTPLEPTPKLGQRGQEETPQDAEGFSLVPCKVQGPGHNIKRTPRSIRRINRGCSQRYSKRGST